MSKVIAGINAETQDRAGEAVKAFRRMIPSLNAYARAISGDPKVTVRATSAVPRTDGTTIFLPPPIQLGDKTTHLGSECDNRGDDGRKVCPACRIRESVFVNIIHELSHIVFGSFKDGNAKADAFKENNYLPHIWNALEDSRVDTAMFKARPGVRPMMQADIRALLSGESFLDDERYVPIFEAPLVSQINIALYLQAAGYEDWKGYLNFKVVTDIEDPILLESVGQAATAASPAEVLKLSRRVYKRLVALGYYEQPEPENNDDQQDSQPEGTGDADELGQEPSGTDRDSGQDASSDSSSDNANNQSDDLESTDSGDEAGGAPDQDAAVQSGGSGREGESSSSGLPGDSSDQSAGVAERSELEGSSERPEDVGDAASDPDFGDEQDDRDDGAGESGNDRDFVSQDDGTPRDGGESESDTRSGNEGSTEGDEGEADGRADDGDSPQLGAGADESATGEADDGPDDQGSSPSQGRTGEADAGAESQGDEDLEDSSQDPGHEGDADHVQHSENGGSDSGEPSSDGNDRGGSSHTGEEDCQSVDHRLLDQDAPIDTPSDSQEGDQGAEDRSEAREAAGEDSEAEQAVETPEGEGVRAEFVPRMGDHKDAAAALEAIHAEDVGKLGEAAYDESDQESLAIAVAVIQGDYFETPSTEVVEVNEYTYNSQEPGWDTGNLVYHDRVQTGVICDMDVPESVIGGNLLRTRRIFTDNVTRGIDSNRRSGRVDPRKLGRRAWIDGEDRLFSKRVTPNKKSYAVQILMDISSSNRGSTLALLKRSVMAQAELMHRVGIDFAITAHSGSARRLTPELGGEWVYALNFHHVREWGQPWDNYSKNALGDLASLDGNLDGHALEFGRKQIMRQEATDRIILYYTDGKMPAANHDEELEVLQSQIRHCKRDGVVLLGVGMLTDSPVQHGLDTVVVNDDGDLSAVVDHLGKRLGGGHR